MPSTPGNNYDLSLTISGTNYGFMLYQDPQTGQRHSNSGLAPLLTPQHRITEFSYEHIPPEIDVPAAFENWADGAGFTEFIGNSAGGFPGFLSIVGNTPHGYAYSQGLDLSWVNRVYVSPARNADNASTGGAIAATPSFYWYSAYFGFYCVAGASIYRYDLASGTWVLKLTASAAVTSLAELSGVLYASITGTAYQYTTSTTADSWTVATLSGTLTSDIADLFVVRGAALFAMRLEVLYSTTNGQNGGTNWGGATTVGSSTETTKSMLTVNGDLWIFKREGIYNFDGTTVSQIWSPRFNTATNGTNAYAHFDGLIYVCYESRILGLDPFNTTTSPLQFVYPAERINKSDPTVAPHDSLELKGTISQITGTFSDLLFTVTNNSGRTYLMKLEPSTSVAHSVAYLGTNASTACFAVGPGVMHATNPCVATGYGAAAVHYIWPYADMRPEDDTAYRFDTTLGVVYGPWLSFGARAFYKFLNRGTVLGLKLSAGSPAVLQYEVDNSGSPVTLVSAQDSGLTQQSIATEVQFNRTRYIINMTAADSQSCPIVVAATLHATLNPPRRRMWKPLVEIKENSLLRDGSEDKQDPTILREALFGSADKRITLTDRNGYTYIVRVLDIQEQILTPTREGSDDRDSQVFQVTLAEITTLTTNLTDGVYDQDAYNTGKVYG